MQYSKIEAVWYASEVDNACQNAKRILNKAGVQYTSTYFDAIYIPLEEGLSAANLLALFKLYE